MIPCPALGQGQFLSLSLLLWKVGTGPALRFRGQPLRPPTGTAAPCNPRTGRHHSRPPPTTPPPDWTGALQEEVLLPYGVQGTTLDLGDLDALGWQWATSLAALAEAEALLLVWAGLLHGPRGRQDAQHAVRVTEA